MVLSSYRVEMKVGAIPNVQGGKGRLGLHEPYQYRHCNNYFEFLVFLPFFTFLFFPEMITLLTLRALWEFLRVNVEAQGSPYWSS